MRKGNPKPTRIHLGVPNPPYFKILYDKQGILSELHKLTQNYWTVIMRVLCGFTGFITAQFV